MPVADINCLFKFSFSANRSGRLTIKPRHTSNFKRIACSHLTATLVPHLAGILLMSDIGNPHKPHRRQTFANAIPMSAMGRRPSRVGGGGKQEQGGHRSDAIQARV